MPFRHVWVEPEVVLTHKNIVVYRCYTHSDVDQPEDFVFSTNRLGTDSSHPDAFDIRAATQLRAVHRMRAYPDKALEMISEALVEAIEAGLIPIDN